jgi:hypothetical protein
MTESSIRCWRFAYVFCMQTDTSQSHFFVVPIPTTCHDHKDGYSWLGPSHQDCGHRPVLVVAHSPVPPQHCGGTGDRTFTLRRGQPFYSEIIYSVRMVREERRRQEPLDRRPVAPPLQQLHELRVLPAFPVPAARRLLPPLPGKLA